jgi:hypothetical protein
MGGMQTPRFRVLGRRQDVQGAVQAAVAAAHHTRPASGTHAGQHAVWWARTASALALIAEHEADPARAEAARADAGTARRLAEGMGAAHTAQVAEVEPAASSPSNSLAVEELDFDALEVGI